VQNENASRLLTLDRSAISFHSPDFTKEFQELNSMIEVVHTPENSATYSDEQRDQVKQLYSECSSVKEKKQKMRKMQKKAVVKSE
jgi:hypothetical protein